MWLPSDEPKNKLYGNKLDKSYLPLYGYIRVLNDDYESILFLNEDLIVGAWYLDAKSLNELYENDAMEMVKILPESRIEIYEARGKLFKTIIELNDECKLSLPIRIDMFWDKIGLNNTDSRDELLSKYRINEPSVNDVESLINGYKSNKED
jgi:hypothetical protein